MKKVSSESANRRISQYRTIPYIILDNKQEKMLALTHRDFVLLKEVTSNLSYHWLPDVREYDLTLFGNTEYLYSRLLQKEYSLKLSPLLFTIAKSPLAHLNENDFLIPLSMFLKNVMPESMALHFKLEHFKNMGAHSKPNESECLLVGRWPHWLLFIINPESHCSPSLVSNKWPPGQIHK